VTSSLAAFEDATCDKSVYIKIMIENKEKKNMEVKEIFLHKFPSNT